MTDESIAAKTSGYPIKVEAGAISMPNFKAFQAEAEERAGKLRKQYVDPVQLTEARSLITNSNKWVKAQEQSLDEVKAQILDQTGYTAFAATIDGEIQKVRSGVSDLSARKREAEIERKKQDCRKAFDDYGYNEPDAFGEVVDFEDVWDPEWGKTTVTKADMLAKMVAKVRKLKEGDPIVNATITITGVKASKLAEVEAFLLKKGLLYEIERS